MNSPTFVMREEPILSGVRIVVEGELDLSAAPILGRRLRTNLRAGAHQLLDLSEVTFIDSTGLAAIIKTFATGPQRELVTIRPSRHGQPRQLFELVNIESLFVLEKLRAHTA